MYHEKLSPAFAAPAGAFGSAGLSADAATAGSRAGHPGTGAAGELQSRKCLFLNCYWLQLQHMGPLQPLDNPTLAVIGFRVSGHSRVTGSDVLS